MKSLQINRILHLLIVGSFFLPFATVKSCMGDETEGSSYTGIQLLAEESGSLLVAVLALAALLFVFSFRRPALSELRNGLVSTTKALLCAFAMVVTFFATGMAFMFSPVSLQVGFYVCFGSWLVLEVLHTLSGFSSYRAERNECREQPPPWGLVVASLAAIVIVAVALVSQPAGFGELVLGVAAGLLLTVPIVVFAMLLAVWYRKNRQEA